MTVESPHCDHVVQVYRRSDELAGAVARFLAAGFDAHEPAVVIATPPHWQLIATRLVHAGWDAGELEANGSLFVRDAESTLTALGDGPTPSSKRFDDVVGSLLHEAAGGDAARRVRAFGEMVDILVQRREREAADVLEGYWNELARARNFTLLCGYKIDLFDLEAQTQLVPQVHRSHAHVLPADDEDRFAAAVERALTDVLGEADAKKVYTQAARATVDAPPSQLALIWISAHMPRTAGRVLAAARDHYAAAA